MIPYRHIRLSIDDKGLSGKDIITSTKRTIDEDINHKCDSDANLPLINVKNIVSYLPYLDIKNKSEGHGIYTARSCYYSESDGTIIGLRPGTNGTDNNLFYNYAIDYNVLSNSDIIRSDIKYPIDSDDIIGQSQTGFGISTSIARTWIESNDRSYDPDKVKTTDVTSYVDEGDLCILDNDTLYKISLSSTEADLSVINISTATTEYSGRVFDPLNPLDINYLAYENSLVAYVKNVSLQWFYRYEDTFILLVRWDVTYENLDKFTLYGFITFTYDSTLQFTPKKTFLFDPGSDKYFYPIIPATKLNWNNDGYYSFNIINNSIVISYNNDTDQNLDLIKTNSFNINELGNYIVHNYNYKYSVLPFDLSILGKDIYHSVYISNDEVITKTKQYTYPGKWIDNKVKVTIENNINTKVELDTNKYIGYCYDGVNDTDFAIILDGNIVKDNNNNTLDTLPDNWKDQCLTFIQNDQDYYSKIDSFSLLYLTSTKYILVYSTLLGASGYHKYSIVDNNGTTLTFAPAVKFVTDYATTSVLDSGNEFAGIFIADVSTVYVALTGCNVLIAAERLTSCLVAKIDITSNTALSAISNPLYTPNDLTLYGIHKLYGPYVSTSNRTSISMRYVDNTSITDTVTRLTTSFDSILDKTDTISTRTLVTIDPPTNLNLYCRDGYGVFNTKLVEFKPKLIDIESYFATLPSDIYLYLNLDDENTLEIDIDDDFDPLSLCVGHVSIDTTALTLSINLINPVYIDKYRLYNSNDTDSISSINAIVTSDSYRIDSKFCTHLLSATKLIYPVQLVDFIGYELDELENLTMFDGVCKLSYYASTISTATIAVPNATKILVACIGSVNSGDGYNHAYLDLGTYLNVFTENIINNTFDIKCVSGAAVDLDYVWVHWIAIGR